MRYVTLAQLKKLVACEEQRAIFEKIFGQRVAVTIANVLKATEAGLDVVALCDRFTGPRWREWDRCILDLPLGPTSDAQKRAHAMADARLLGNVRMANALPFALTTTQVPDR